MAIYQRVRFATAAPVLRKSGWSTRRVSRPASFTGDGDPPPLSYDGAPRRVKGAIVLGGAHGSLAIARSLGRRGIPVWLITADYPLASLSRYVERSLRWRGPRTDGALDFLIELGQRHGLHGWVLFAGSDEDMQFVARNCAPLGKLFVITTLAWDRVRLAYDKRCMNARADQLGIAHPRTHYPRSRDDLKPLGIPFPVILKATVREGHNRFVDAKAWRIDDQQTLLSRYDEARLLVDPDRIMIQELIPGDGTAQFSYAALWHRGEPIASLIARRRRQFPILFGFTSTFVESIEQPSIEADACLFLASLEYSGLVEIEFKYDQRDGLYKILDVNARSWTWIAIGSVAGVDFPLLQWRLATGEHITPHRGCCGARWLYFSRDLAAAILEIFAGKLSPFAYLRSFGWPLAWAAFAWDDPLPAVLDVPLSAVRITMRFLGRRKEAAPPVSQPAKLQRLTLDLCQPATHRGPLLPKDRSEPSAWTTSPENMRGGLATLTKTKMPSDLELS